MAASAGPGGTPAPPSASLEGPLPEGGDDFVCVLDFVCKRLLRERPADPFAEVVSLLASWGSEKQKMKKLRPMESLPALLAKSVTEVEAATRRAIVHVNLSTPLDPATGEPLHTAAVTAVARTLQAIVVQCPTVVLCHFEDLYTPQHDTLYGLHESGEEGVPPPPPKAAEPPSVRVLLPLLRAVVEPLNAKLTFADSLECEALRSRSGSGEVVVVENLLRMKGELACDRSFAIALSKLGDLMVCDSFPSLAMPYASTSLLPFLVAEYCVGQACGAHIRAVHRATSDPALPCVVCFGGTAPVEGLRATALAEAVTISDEVLLAARPALLHAYAAALRCGDAGGAEALPLDPAPGDEEVAAVEAAAALSRRLGRRLTVPVDHLVLAKRMRRQTRVPKKQPRVLARYEVAEGFPVAEGTVYAGVGPQTVAAYAAKLARAATGIVIGEVGVVKLPRVEQQGPRASGHGVVVNLEECPTRRLLHELAEAAQTRGLLLLGDSLVDLVEQEGLSERLRKVVPGMCPALTLFVS